MGALDRFLRRGRQQDGYKPMIKRLEAAMLSALRSAGASAWYVADDFLTLGPELVVNGKFDAGLTGWMNTNASASVVVDQGGNVLSLSASGGGSSLNQLPNLEVGKSYLFSYRRRGVNAGSGLAGRLSIVYTDATSLTFPAAVATVRPDYELINEVQMITKPVTSFKLLATLASSDFVGNVYYDDVSIREVLSAKDFADSTGTNPAYLSGTAGLLFDAAGVPGAELIANPHTSASWLAEGTTPPTALNGADSYLGKTCRSVTFPAVAAGGYSVCWARDGENIFNVVAGVTYTASFEYALSRDLASGESISIAVTGSSGIYARNLLAGAPGGVWVSGAGSQPAQASGGGPGLRPYATVLNSPLTVYVRALSVKVTGGNVVTQATAGSRPTVTRIPRKLGPELMTGIAITGTNGTNTGSATANSFTINQVDTSSVVGATLSLSAVPTLGKSYYITSIPSGLSGSGFKVDNVAWTPTAAQVSAGFILTATSSPSAAIYVYRNTAPAAGAFSNVSVREVLEWSYALNFDGANDSLSAPASIIGATLTQPYTMIAWGKVGALGANRWMLGDSARLLGISSNNKVAVGHAGTQTYDSSYTPSVGEVLVAEATYDGGASVKAWVNGIQVMANGGSAAPTTPASATNIGQRGNASAYWQGEIGGCVVCPAVMSDAVRLAVRRFAAAQMGLVL